MKNKILRKLGISYLKRILRVINGPVFVSIFFTRKCNFNCYYCVTSKNIQKNDISLKQWKDIITQIYNHGCRFITIYGGEPTLRSDLGELIKYCIDLNIFTHVVSNGSLLNEELLEEFASYGYFLLGISIDGFSETNFSPKVYRPELIELLHKIKEKYPDNIDYSIHIIPTKENIDQVKPLIKTINSKLECRFSIDPVHSSLNPDEEYKYRSYCPDLLIKKEDMDRIRKMIQFLKRQGVQFFSPNIYYYYMNKWYQGKYSWNCDAGDLYYAIDNDGTVMLCEDVSTSIPFSDYIKLSHRKRVKAINKFKFEYCDCFKPCYWNPTNLVKHPIRNLRYRNKLK
ncbi:MAG: radical SAM protein [Candidatus Odinarchaeota archaeon]